MISCVDCENGCNENFALKTIKEMLFHHQICKQNIKETPLKHCLQCSRVFHKDKLHHCMINITSNWKELIKRLTKQNENSIIREGVLEEKINKLEDKVIILERIVKSNEIELSQLRQDFQIFKQKFIGLEISKACLPLATPCGHESTVYSLLQIDDFLIASGSEDNTIKFWDLKLNKCLFTIKEHKGAVVSLIKLNDGRLASGSYDKTIKLWNLTSKQCVAYTQ